MPRNIRELLETQAQRSPRRTFLSFFDDGRDLSYSELNQRVNQIANLLLNRNIGKGQTVSLLLPNIPEYVLCYFACLKIGAVAGPVNVHLKSAEIQYVLENSESRLLVTAQRFLPLIEPIRKQLPNLEHVLLADGASHPTHDLLQLMSKQSVVLAPTSLEPDDEALIIYTSGTTGKPKGCLLTHDNFLCNARDIAHWLKFTSHDRLLCIMPLFHVNGIVVTMMTPLFVGGQIVLTERFSTRQFWDVIARYQVTSFGSVATMLSMLSHTEYPEGYLASLNTQSLRFALCGSAPVPAEVLRDFEEKFRCLVVEGYGLSEATCRVTFNPPDGRRCPGSIGLPIGNRVRVVDEEDVDVATGSTGEIIVRGGNVMKGYHKNPEATAQTVRGGWLHTGDLGYQDQNGFYHIVDRKSDMIIRGGENIYPREIDNVLFEHPKILEAATVGVPDELYGEDVKAFVVLKKGETATVEELLSFCRQRLADYKCPKRIEFLSEIPKGPTGKLLRRELAKDLKVAGLSE